MAIHITDRETDALVRRLASVHSIGLTEAIRLAVTNELARVPDNAKAERVTPLGSPTNPIVRITDRATLERSLDARIRSVTLDYTRLMAKERGTKGVGSRVYQMLARYGAIGTLDRLVDRPTDGLEFLKRMDRLDLAAETIALDWYYEPIISDDIRSRAKANLAKVGG